MIELVKVDTPSGRSRYPPLGLLYVGDALNKEGYNVDIHHCTKDQILDLARHIAKRDPLFVGFSVVTGFSTRYSLEMSREIKRRSDTPIVWGGPHPTLLPEQCLSEPWIDLVVLGEGEETSVELARALEKKTDLNNVRGIGYKKEGKTRLTPRRPFIKDLDKYRLNWELIEVKNYLYEHIEGYRRVLSYVSSRGCPHRCGFCYNLVANRRRWRSHSPEFTIRDIERLREDYGIDAIRFYDDNFFANKKRAEKILRTINLPWFGEVRIDYVDEPLAKLMKETNCTDLLIGAESGSNRLLDLMQKDLTVSQTLRGARKLAEHKIHTCFSFILGLPTETWNETQKTIDLLLRIDEIHPDTTFTVGPYLPFPGTPLYQLAAKEGFKTPERTEGWEILDRKEGPFRQETLPWIDQRVYLISAYCDWLGIRAPLFPSLIRFRLKGIQFSLPFDLQIIRRMYGKNPEGGYNYRNTTFAKTIRRLVYLYRNLQERRRYAAYTIQKHR